MTDKEKVKAYDEAIERANKVLLDCTKEERNVVEYLHPELKKNEDERIKKALLSHFSRYKGDEIFLNGITMEQIVGWIEKQGKQKSAEKVEPKFKAGDWILHCGTEQTYQVVGIKDNKYQLKCNGNYTEEKISDVERCARAWDINKDAKDGDVLFCPMDKNSEVEGQIFLFYGVRNRDYVNNCIEYYCRVHDGVFYVDENGYMGTTSSPVYPATKEQRELLFQKMHDAGYEWDAECKQLNKLIKK